MKPGAVRGRLGSFPAWAVTSLLAIVISTALSPSALGQFCPTPLEPCDPSDPTSKCYKPKKPDCACKDFCQMSPCFVATGAYDTSVMELQIKTVGLPLEVSRSYTSSHAIDGPLGFGWISNLTARLYYAAYLFSAPNTYSTEADVVMPDGSLYKFVQNTDGSFTPPKTRHDVLVHNGDGTFDLTIQRSRTKLHFDPSGVLLSYVDEFGNALNYLYDGSGKLQSVSDGAGSGRYVDVFWGPDGRIATIQDNSTRRLDYVYDAQGALSTATTTVDATRSLSTSYSYVAGRFSPLLSQIKDNWDRVVSDVTYDDRDRVQSYTDGGETYTYTYVYQGNSAITSKADSSGNTFIYPFSPDGFVNSDTAPDGWGPTYSDYYQDGLIRQFTDVHGVKTFYTYTQDGNPATVTRDYQGAQAIRFDYAYDPAFPTKLISYTPRDPLTGLDNHDWQAWQYDYYQSGPAPGALFHVYRLQNDFVTRDTLVTYEYNSHGQMTRQTRASGGVIDYSYDAQGNLHTITLPSNNDAATRPVITYGYDSLGRVTSVTDALSRQTTYAYDDRDRFTEMTLPKPSVGSSLTFTTTYSYDNYDASSGLTFTNTLDQNSSVAKQGVDQFGQLTQSVDPQGNLTTYLYDKGLLRTMTDANGNVTTYSYDGLRRLSQLTSPDGTYEAYQYDRAGPLTYRRDRNGMQMNFWYDHLGRLTGAFGEVYTYQGQQLIQVADSTGNHYVGYDSHYRVSSVTDPAGTINYQYTTDDSLSNYSVQSGPSTTFTYYPDGSVSTIVWSPVAGNFKYHYTLTGQTESVTFPNGATRNYTYDDQGRLTNLTNLNSGGTNRATYSYAYDHNWTTGLDTMLGQRTSMTATVPSQGLSNRQFKYEYDGDYRLNKVTYPNVAPFSGEVDSWTYDAIGNRLTSTVNSTTTSYSYQRIGSNPLNWQRLLNDGSNGYTYDSNGNALTRGGSSFTWDNRDRLTGVTGVSTYVYDSWGRRSSKTVGSATNTYLYDGLNLVKETGAAPADYLFGPGIDEPLAMSRGGSTYYYGVDGLGSITLVLDSSFVVQDKYLYDAWGQVRSSAVPVLNPFGYTGREIGEASTLFYRARYYQPSIGRFLGEDVSDENGATNLFAYVGSDPLKYGDPLGLDAVLKPAVPVPPAPVSRPLPTITRVGPWAGVIVIVLAELLDPPNLGDPDSDELLEPARPNQPRRPRQFWTCIARCHVKNYANVPNAPPFTEAYGYGRTREEAAAAAINFASSLSPPGTHCRHCKPRKCWR